MKFCQWASILTQRLPLYLLSAWGQKGWGHLLTARGLGVVGRPRGGGVGCPWGASEAPLSCQHWVWEGWWSGTITKIVKGIASWEFPKEQSLVEYNPECQTPPYEKNKWLLNEYLGDFIHFETLFFLNPSLSESVQQFSNMILFNYWLLFHI